MRNRFDMIIDGLGRSKFGKQKSIKESSLGTTRVGNLTDKVSCEGTDVSCVSTPSGKVGSNKITCPKCRGENVNIRNDKVFHCSDCDKDWELDGKQISESSKYQVGKRYRTEDNMYFVVKKVNKDGTIRVYDEDIEKEYNCELSDLELLDPQVVK